jgi:hypothetical protein
MTWVWCTTLVVVCSDRPNFLAGCATAGYTLLFCGLFSFGLLFWSHLSAFLYSYICASLCSESLESRPFELVMWSQENCLEADTAWKYLYSCKSNWQKPINAKLFFMFVRARVCACLRFGFPWSVLLLRLRIVGYLSWLSVTPEWILVNKWQL